MAQFAPLALIKRALAATKRRVLELTDDSGIALVEFAFALPVLMAVLVGMLMFGITINNYLSVTNAAQAGAFTLSISRTTTTTPYTNTLNAIYGAAPILKQANLTVAMSVNGTACTTDATCAAALSSVSSAVQSGTVVSASVHVSYPCDLRVLNVSYLSNCAIGAQTTERIQ